MPFDAGVMAAVVHSLETEAVGARIEKVCQPERDEILLHLRSKNGSKKHSQRPAIRKPFREMAMVTQKPDHRKQHSHEQVCQYKGKKQMKQITKYQIYTYGNPRQHAKAVQQRCRTFKPYDGISFITSPRLSHTFLRYVYYARFLFSYSFFFIFLTSCLVMGRRLYRAFS